MGLKTNVPQECLGGGLGGAGDVGGGGSGWYCVPSFFAENLVSFKLELAVYIHVPDFPSFLSVNSVSSAPSKPVLKAEPGPLQLSSLEAQQLPRPAEKL